MSTIRRILKFGFAFPLFTFLLQAQCGPPPAPPPPPLPPAPALTSVSPSSVVNSAGTMIAITGANFAAGDTVTIGGVACASPTVLSATLIQCSLPARAGVCGPQTVVVTDSRSQSATSSTLFRFRSASLAFAAPLTIPTGTNPDHLTAVDLDGDGRLDLVNTNRSTNNVTVVHGKGDGTFGASVSTMVGMSPIGLAIGDFNGDKLPDAIVTNGPAATTSTLLNGMGNFVMTKTTNVGMNGPNGIALGDLNGDRKLDAVIADNNNANAAILIGDGAGNFTVGGQNPGGFVDPHEVVLGDLNGDGFLDLVMSNFTSNLVSWNLGNGDGTFKATMMMNTGTGPEGLALADYNADGKLDLAVANYGDATVAICLGNGMGGFGAPKTLAVGTMPRGVTAADLNADGIIDLAVANDGTNNISLLIGKGDGTFTSSAQTTIAVGMQPFRVATGDVNGNYGSAYIGWSITACRSWNHGLLNCSASRCGSFDPSAAGQSFRVHTPDRRRIRPGQHIHAGRRWAISRCSAGGHRGLLQQPRSSAHPDLPRYRVRGQERTGWIAGCAGDQSGCVYCPQV